MDSGGGLRSTYPALHRPSACFVCASGEIRHQVQQFVSGTNERVDAVLSEPEVATEPEPETVEVTEADDSSYRPSWWSPDYWPGGTSDEPVDVATTTTTVATTEPGESSTTVTTSTTTTPGVPNTGAGDIVLNAMILGVSVMIAVIGAVYLYMHRRVLTE